MSFNLVPGGRCGGHLHVAATEAEIDDSGESTHFTSLDPKLNDQQYRIMKLSEFTKQIGDLKFELEIMAKEETEYTCLPEPSRILFEEHTARLKRFQEITQELLRLAQESAH